MQIAFVERFCDFSKEKTCRLSPSLLNITSFIAVRLPDLELELADIADKDVWVSKFRSLTRILKILLARRPFLLKIINGENLFKPDKLAFDTWNAIPDLYMNMKKHVFGVLSIF